MPKKQEDVKKMATLYEIDAEKKMGKEGEKATSENTELIRVTQLPIIEERLRTMKTQIDEEVARALSLVCTEETVIAVRKIRADLNKQFNELEEKRKAVKQAVLSPYEKFEAIYRECVSDAFKKADINLKNKISDVENTMKDRCETAARMYFAELCADRGIDFVKFEEIGIQVSMTDAKAKQQPPKRICSLITEFVDLVSYDMRTISAMENAEEIAVEYKNTLHVGKAIAIVQERHKQIKAEKVAQEQREAAAEQEAEAVRRVEAFAPPVVDTTPTKLEKVRMTFTVTDTIDRLKMLKRFLVANGYKFE